jgi:hypothetical protein
MMFSGSDAKPKDGVPQRDNPPYITRDKIPHEARPARDLPDRKLNNRGFTGRIIPEFASWSKKG